MTIRIHDTRGSRWLEVLAGKARVHICVGRVFLDFRAFWDNTPLYDMSINIGP